MKITIFIFAILGCLISALPLLEAQQAGHLAPRLAPRLAPHLASRLASRFINYNITSKAIITPQDNCQRNFTHNELFTLQKKFLDNFIYPNNTLQVRFRLET